MPQSCDADAVPTSLVTGATAGIGLAFARALAGRGDDLVLVARDEPRLSALAGELTDAYAVSVRALSADLASDDGVARVAAALTDTEAPVDLLVNNAGFGLAAAFVESPAADEVRALNVMVRAPMLLCHAALPGMLTRGRGTIVNVSSVAGFLPRGTYGAHKAWLTGFSGWLDLTHRAQGVRVLALCPGFVRTEFHRRMDVDMTGIPGWMWLDADRVVATALADLDRGVRVSIPSRRYQVLARLARVAPLRLTERAGRRAGR